MRYIGLYEGNGAFNIMLSERCDMASEKPSWCMSVGEQYVEDNPVKYDHTHASEVEYTRAVQAAYRRMAWDNLQLFAVIDIPVLFQEDDPYDNYQDMKDTVDKEGKLRIFSGGSAPRNLSRVENCIGRAVHDYYGHLGYDVDFSPKGEFMKWYHMVDYYPESVTQLLFAEVVAQVAAVHYSGGFSYNQRDILAPPQWIEDVCQYYDKPVPEGAYYWD